MKLQQETAARIALKILSEQPVFSAAETEKRFAQAVSPGYWKELNPQLNVCAAENSDNLETAPPLGEAENAAMLRQRARSGYFQTPPLIEKPVLRDMCEGVENLRRAGWHELSAFVYDEFWQATRTASLGKLLAETLGSGFSALPHVVVHYVRPETGAGWKPHIDFSDRADRFTVWVALNDATLDNGCIYVVPKERVSADLLEKWMKTVPLTHKEVCRLLHAARALPAPAGSVLGWEGDVIHWGTPSSAGAFPRISLSVVYLRENIEPLKDEIPLLSPRDLPDFAQRMLAVGKAFNYYGIHDLALRKYADLSKKLIAEFGRDD